MIRLLCFLTISTFLFFTACQKDIEPNLSIESTTKLTKAKPTVGLKALSASDMMCVGDVFVPLFAGQNDAVGVVSFRVDTDGVLTLCASNSCSISEQHIFVGAESDLTGFKNGNLSPGKFAVSDSGQNASWTFDVSEFQVNNEYCFAVAYHAVGCKETIWAGQNDRSTKGNWSSYQNLCFSATTQ